MSAVQAATTQYRPAGSLDAATALLPYTGPWTPKLAAHLLRRAGFGGSPTEIDNAAAAGMNAAVDALINFSHDSMPQAPDADLSYGRLTTPEQKRQANIAMTMWFLNRVLLSPNPLLERMTYFWSNHFTSSVDGGVTPQMLVNQYALFRRNALGNFSDLTHQVSQDPAMLFYLNGAQNNKRHPNENYARELMELFTLGVGNYTEDDVRESARSFTGWTVNRQDYTAQFVPRLHDDGQKTFLGQTGNFNGDDIVDILLRQPVAAQFVAHKFLRHFVYDDPEPELVAAAADILRSSGYNVRVLMNGLLRSNVFYSPRAYRALIKSPLELAVGSMKLVGATEFTPRLAGGIVGMGQIPMRPPNVAGWPGGAQWMNQSTELARLNFANQLVYATPVANVQATAASMAPAMATSPPSGPPAMPAMSTPMEWIGGANTADPGAIAERIIWIALQDDANESQRSSILSFLQTDGVGNLVTLNGENLDEKVRGAMSLAMATAPYQLA
jgi:uncharacterized protein (DUF1800 family)